MDIIKIKPQGFCKGVISAITTLNTCLENNDYKKPLYMLGGLVHNKNIINAYINKGIKIITFEDIESIDKGTIIITAHGLSNKKRNFILNKGLSIIDTTCKEVKKIQDLVYEKERENYSIIYYGSSNHPECKAIIEDHNNINLIQSKDDIKNLSISNNKVLFASQTTASYELVNEIETLLKFRYPFIETTTDICNATKTRQLALIEESKNYDIILVIGDKKSNNTNKLVEIANEYSKGYLIDQISDLDDIDFSNVNTIGITAGASTPNILVDEIILKLKDNKYIINLTDDDYINIKKK